MRLLLILVLLFPLKVYAQPTQAPGHIPEFPHIDFRWTKDESIYAFARYDIDRLDRSPSVFAEYNTDMRNFLASVFKVWSLGELTMDLSSFKCDHYDRPLGHEWSIRIKYISLCFLNNALMLVNIQYSQGVSADEIIANLDKRYIKMKDTWTDTTVGQDQLFEAYPHKNANIVSYINRRYYMMLRSGLTYNWQWDDGKKDKWNDTDLFPRPAKK